jgi:hypothetical protein
MTSISSCTALSRYDGTGPNTRYTDAWIEEAKGWQTVAWQPTPIAAPAATVV